MNLQTHKQKSLKIKKISDVEAGDVVVFKDPSATTDAKEQLGIVYRVLGRGGQYFAMTVLPLNAVSDIDHRQNPELYKKNDRMRLIVEKGSKDVRELGVNTNFYYTVGASIRKYENDINIADRDRFRVLPIHADQTLLGDDKTVKCLGRAGADLMDKIDTVMTNKFRNDPDTKIVFDDDVKNAALVTLGRAPEEPKYQAVGMRQPKPKQAPAPVTAVAPKTSVPSVGSPVRMGDSQSKPTVSGTFSDLAKTLNARTGGTHTPRPKTVTEAPKTETPSANKPAQAPSFMRNRWGGL